MESLRICCCHPDPNHHPLPRTFWCSHWSPCAEPHLSACSLWLFCLSAQKFWELQQRGPGPQASPLLGGPLPAAAQQQGRAQLCPSAVLSTVSLPALSMPMSPVQGCPSIPTCSWSLVPGVQPPDLSRSFLPIHLLSIKAYPSCVPLPLSLLPAEGHVAHGATGVMGRPPLVPYLCFARTSLELGAFQHDDNEGGSRCSRDGNAAGQLAGGGQLCGEHTDLPLSFLAFGSNGALEKNTRMTLVGGTCFHGVWPNFKDNGASGCWEQPVRAQGALGVGGGAVPPSITAPAGRELAGVTGNVVGAGGGAAKSVSQQDQATLGSRLQRLGYRTGPGTLSVPLTSNPSSVSPSPTCWRQLRKSDSA